MKRVRIDGLTRTQIRALRAVRQAQAEGFDGYLTSRRTKRSTMVELRELGLVDSLSVYVADGDGGTKQPEREREGWKLTDAGAALLGEADAIRGSVTLTLRFFAQPDGTVVMHARPMEPGARTLAVNYQKENARDRRRALLAMLDAMLGEECREWRLP